MSDELKNNAESGKECTSEGCAEEAPCGKWRPDWLTIAIVLIIALNVGLYLQTRHEFGSQAGDSLGQVEAPDPGREGGPDPWRAPGDKSEPGPERGVSMPPRGGEPGPAPGGAGASQDSDADQVARRLISAEGQAAIKELEKESAPLALTAEQGKELKDLVERKLLEREAGGGVVAITSMLNDAQRAYLQEHKDQLTDARLATEGSAVKTALVRLSKKVGSAQAGNVKRPASPPQYNPETISVGLLLLENEGGSLEVSAEQAASMVPVLESMEKATSGGGKTLDQILNAKQIEWLKQRLGTSADGNGGADGHV